MAESKKKQVLQGDYLVLKGLDYDNKRAEPGDILSDLPESAIPWLLEQNVIELSEGEDS